MFHKVILVGNLGRDPEMRYTAGGQPVTSFSVASNRRYTDSSGQNVEETIWFRVSVWGKQAEACKQYLAKGRQVLVEGRLICDKQTGGPRTFKRANGETGTSFEINAEVVRFLGQRGDAAPAEGESGPAAAPGTEEEIPF
ncbi:MAG: single-stranded DNA-binding protein [Anaerolineales bacterium]|nr:single-stranded DNA-binding protein [Anaerolineales bacterium]